MKAALIPPKGYEKWASRSYFHLCLAQELWRSEYREYYRDLATTGEYVILDNGIAENDPVEGWYLLEQARALGVQEVVLPDVMRSIDGTQKAVSDFLKKYGTDELGPRYMGVVQGRTLTEFQTCAGWYADQPIDVLGIPRHMISTLKDRKARLEFANWVKRQFNNRFQIHLLGTNPEVTSEMQNVGSFAPHIRSVDSSIAFCYTIEGVELPMYNFDKAPVVHRPEGYFSKDWNLDEGLLAANIMTYLRWAEA